MKILKALIFDVPELTALVNSAYRGQSSSRGWTNEGHLLEGDRIDEPTLYDYFLDANNTLFKCLDAENKIIACVHLQHKGSTLYLGMLTVKPELQSGGIGRALLQMAEAQAKQLQCTTITMSVIASRHELIAYYKRRGYCITGEMQPFPTEHHKFGKPKTALELMIMEKIVNET